MFTIDFDKVRPLFGGRLTQDQVDGINCIVDAYNKYGDENKQRLAQCLGTTKWETGQTMQPIKETQRASEKSAPSDETVIKRLDAAFAKGQLKWVSKPYWKGGWFGRGYVQLTHEANYKGPARQAVLREFGVDIHAERYLVMRPDIAAFILIRGSIEGWFTGKGLADYIDDLDESDAEDMLEYVASRRVVNGTDRAREIAEFSLGFEKALTKKGPEAERPKAKVPPKVDPDAPISPRKKGFWEIIFDFFLNLLPKGN